MSRSLRLEFPGALWHITSRGNEQRDIVRDDDDRRFLLDLLGEAVDRFNWILYQYVLMTNHYHLVIELAEESLSKGMKWLNGKYAQAFNKRHRRVGHLFQGRPHESLVEKETYFLNVIRYVALNPVRAQMVARPEHYAWGSHRAIVGLCEAPSWLNVERTLSTFAPDTEIARRLYKNYVDAGIGADVNPWREMVGQIYLGSEEWVERMRSKVEEKPRSDEFPSRQRNPVARRMADVIATVSRVLSIEENDIRFGRGGLARTLAAWVGSRLGLDLRSIAAALRLRSAGRTSDLVKKCELALVKDAAVQDAANRCLEILRAV